MGIEGIEWRENLDESEIAKQREMFGDLHGSFVTSSF